MKSQPQAIQTLFERVIDRRIEEVIKVDQTDEGVLAEEIEEYVVTDAIRSHYTHIFEAYRETPNKPHEGIAIWISGFFGSGKSSFAKMLGLSVENRTVAGRSASARFAERARNARLQVVLQAINEQIPTHAVIFDVSTDRGIRSGNQTLTEIMYALFLQSLGYAKDLDLSELEIGLEEKGTLAAFEAQYRTLYKKEWNVEKGKVAFALSHASRVLHSLDPETYPLADSWVKAVKDKADISPGKLAERAGELMKRRGRSADGRVKNLLFVVDEVGQFVARDVQKMLDLQAIVQNLGVRGRGKHWLAVTSQEQLSELVSSLGDKKVELARLMDRFPLQVHLEPSDISEVTSRRVLVKNAPAEAALGKLFDEQRHPLTDHTRLTADIKLPELSRQGFIDLYPLLPYQIDLIIQVVSGLRTQSGASKHVGGANRTIIKLAQQLLIHPAVRLAAEPVGALARLDHVYDLVEGNIGSDVRAKIAAIPRRVDHPLAQRVAKVICLLQYVKSVHRTPENIAAALHPSVTSESLLASVKEALAKLEAAQQVRLGEGGYRIPTPAEDDWERTRNAISPKPGDAHRLIKKELLAFWQPQPASTLHESKTFKGGLSIHGRDEVGGDLMFQLHLADDAKEHETLAADLRTRSQIDRKSVFWAVALSDDIDAQVQQLFRSHEMVERKVREGGDTKDLVHEERQRLGRHERELRRLLKAACLSGSVYFRGHDRSPSDKVADVNKAAVEILGQVLPEVFDRFEEAAARPSDVKKGIDALFTADHLQGLPPVFGNLKLLRDEKGKTVFRVDAGPLREVLSRIEERATYGDKPSGRYLTEELSKEPFGWDFDVVRLLVLSLLRAGVIEATNKGVTIDSATGHEASETFGSNNLFRQASFFPKAGGCDFATVLTGAEHVREVFGVEVKEIEESLVAAQIRERMGHEEQALQEAVVMLRTRTLPGAEVLQSALDVARNLRSRRDCPAIQEFSASHRALKDAFQRCAELTHAMNEPRLRDLDRARDALTVAWPFLRQEADLTEEMRSRAETLADLLARETFYRDVPAIEQHAAALESDYKRRYDDAQQACIDAYTKAFQRLIKTPGWAEVSEDTQRRVALPLQQGMTRSVERVPIAQLRSERDACEARLRAAVTEVRRTLDGERLATVNVSSYFAGGVETEEQLDAALDGVREECARLIGAGKKVVVQ